MDRNQTLYFQCPLCEERHASIDELDSDIYTGETYHCSICGGRVVIQVMDLGEYRPPPPARRECTYCNPASEGEVGFLESRKGDTP